MTALGARARVLFPHVTSPGPAPAGLLFAPPGLAPATWRYDGGMYRVPKPGYDLDTMRAVAAAYHQVRQAVRRDQLAREAATAAFLVRHPEIDRRPASKAVGWMIAWAAQEHPDWF